MTQKKKSDLILIMVSNQQVICPKCRRPDSVQKVSAVVAGGTKVTESRGGIYVEAEYGLDVIPLNHTSVSRSVLATKLAAPKKPLQPTSYGCVAAVFMTRLGFGLMVSIMLVALFFCSHPFLVATYSENSALFIGVIVIGIAIIGLILFSSIRASWRQARSISERRYSYDARLQAWEAEYERWKQLYYCFRDDSVFLPGQSSFAPVDQLSDYLKADTKRKRSL